MNNPLYPGFLPVTRREMDAMGIKQFDFVYVTGDSYVDHPSFGVAIIGRVIEKLGFTVGIISQPDWRSTKDFTVYGRPKYAFLVTGGCIDSMVNHYTAAKKRRSDDAYTAGGKAGKRPDRAVIVYCNRIREAYGDVPLVIGGLEASLRRFAHYDYWSDKVRRSILFDSGADICGFGMGETSTEQIVTRLAAGEPVSALTDIAGTCVVVDEKPADAVECPSFEKVCGSDEASKKQYADATRIQYGQQDAFVGKTLVQRHGDKWVKQNPPSLPLDGKDLDDVYDLPFMWAWHPVYDDVGGVPAIAEVEHSVTHNRGCFGGCSFCALAFHQGRMVTSRSHESVIREVTALTKLPDFKGYINDVGGPSANFRHTSCEKQKKYGMCPDKRCLAPTPCPNLDADHSDYLKLLRKLRAIPGIKKVFVRSGIRYDYMLEDKNSEFFSELVKYHISGQLKVAPEHCIDSVLDYMGKPHIDVYEKFMERYKKLNDRYSKEQYVVPYLMSSHPGSTLQDAVALAEYLNKMGRQPEQVQDFYPTPGTISTCMYYTEIDPMTMKSVYVAKSFHDKAMQRALLQWKRPDKRKLVIEALKEAGREDLIGFGPECLVRQDYSPAKRGKAHSAEKKKEAVKAEAPAAKKPVSKKGWAKAKPKKNAKPKSRNK